MGWNSWRTDSSLRQYRIALGFLTNRLNASAIPKRVGVGGKTNLLLRRQGFISEMLRGNSALRRRQSKLKRLGRKLNPASDAEPPRTQNFGKTPKAEGHEGRLSRAKFRIDAVNWATQRRSRLIFAPSKRKSERLRFDKSRRRQRILLRAASALLERSAARAASAFSSAFAAREKFFLRDGLSLPLKKILENYSRKCYNRRRLSRFLK